MTKFTNRNSIELYLVNESRKASFFHALESKQIGGNNSLAGKSHTPTLITFQWDVDCFNHLNKTIDRFSRKKFSAILVGMIYFSTANLVNFKLDCLLLSLFLYTCVQICMLLLLDFLNSTFHLDFQHIADACDFTRCTGQGARTNKNKIVRKYNGPSA